MDVMIRGLCTGWRIAHNLGCRHLHCILYYYDVHEGVEWKPVILTGSVTEGVERKPVILTGSGY